MIRTFESSDMHEVLNIWLEASIGAHGFVGKEFWESRVDDMREIYIPGFRTRMSFQTTELRAFLAPEIRWRQCSLLLMQERYWTAVDE